MVKIPNVEELLQAGMHFGHRTAKWHPKMKPFIFGERKGVHIIDLIKSREQLEKALNFITDLSAKGGKILFVGTKAQVKGLLKKVAKETNMPYVSEHWLGGTMTNFPIIKKNVKKYKDLLEKQAEGKLSKYTKKEQLQFTRQIAKLELSVGGLVDLNAMPDAVFIWDIKNEATALAEAKKKLIPIIAVCDTNVDPTGIAYVIPANDDASKTIKLMFDLIKEAVSEGQAKAASNKELTAKK
jgi:small subunit ribosomal protein S2